MFVARLPALASPFYEGRRTMQKHVDLGLHVYVALKVLHQVIGSIHT